MPAGTTPEPISRRPSPTLPTAPRCCNGSATFVILLCVAYWRWGPPLVASPVAALPVPAVAAPHPTSAAAPAATPLSDVTRACAACHRAAGIMLAQIAEWEDSTHRRAGVGCFECHGAEQGEPDAFDHYGFTVATIVSPKDCARCHGKEADEFQRSRHAEGGQILASLDNFLGETVEGLQATVLGCRQCHGSRVAVLPSGRLAPDCWPNTGIGRMNPDGSRGSCSACHPRHAFRSAVARRPESCGRCHMGPDHPQHEIYRESKHGVAFVEATERMNLSARPWRLGTDYTAAPTCVTCHNTANGKLAATHDVGTRIAWTLRPDVSTRLDGAAERRDRMRTTCLHCHSPGWTDEFFAQYDDAVELSNRKFAEPGKQVMQKLREAGKLTPNPFDEPIEWTWFLVWHHEGRRARHGAAMMGPDYVQWHGFFEVADRFYNHFLPEADALLPGVTADLRAMPDHRWLAEPR